MANMMGRWARAVSAMGLLLLCGCGSGESLEQACSDFEHAAFTRGSTCYGVAPPANEDALIARATQSCVLSSAAAGSHVSASYWVDCTTMVNNQCAGYQCANYPPGDGQVGVPCLASVQCATLWCSGTTVASADGAVAPDAVQCGTCEARLAEGAACDGASDACDIGLSCFKGTCRTRATNGGACLHWADCAPPYICRSTGVCGYVAVQGQACQATIDCTTDVGCDAVTKLCVPLVFGEPGAACDGDVHRCVAGNCDLLAGSCPAVIPDGMPCDPNDRSHVCDDYARCFQGVCQIPTPATCG
jgi:hypothetical protein